jgi:hypothetical protein
MMKEDTAALLVRDGILDKSLETIPLPEKERSLLREEGLVQWALAKQKEWGLKKKIKAQERAKATSAEPSVAEKPLGA